MKETLSSPDRSSYEMLTAEPKAMLPNKPVLIDQHGTLFGYNPMTL